MIVTKMGRKVWEVNLLTKKRILSKSLRSKKKLGQTENLQCCYLGSKGLIVLLDLDIILFQTKPLLTKQLTSLGFPLLSHSYQCVLAVFLAFTKEKKKLK